MLFLSFQGKQVINIAGFDFDFEQLHYKAAFMHCIDVKALANKDALLRTHCCRHKCFPVCQRMQHLLRTQILCPGHKKCFWFCSETFCVHNKCFPVCAAQETWWATMCPQQCVLVYQGLKIWLWLLQRKLPWPRQNFFQQCANEWKLNHEKSELIPHSHQLNMFNLTRFRKMKTIKEKLQLRLLCRIRWT